MYKRLRPYSYIRNVVGLYGKARSGKNYIAEHMIQPLGYVPFAFAWALKHGAVGKNLLSYHDAFNGKHIPQVRQTLQEEGTENGRLVYGEDVWVYTALAWMETLSEHWGVNDFVITDVRFPNEAQMVRDLGGKVYAINAPTRTDNSDLDARARAHASETALEDFAGFDGVINNDIDATDVEEQVLRLMIAHGMWNPMEAIDSMVTASVHDQEKPTGGTE